MDHEIEPSVCLVFFGVRYLSADEIDDETDPRAQAAKAHDLDTWSGRRYPPTDADERPYFLLVGEKIGQVGYDGSCEASAGLSRLTEKVRTATARLGAAGLTGAPALWVQCAYD